MTLFARAEGVELHGHTGASALGLAGRRVVLRFPHEVPRDPAHDGAACVAVRAAGGPFLASLALVEVDWIRRTATLAAARLEGGEALLLPATRRFLRYAREELDLDVIEARPADEHGGALLAALGFAGAPTGRMSVSLRDADVWRS